MKKVVLSLGLGFATQSILAATIPTVTTSIKPVSMVVKAVAGDYAKIEQIVSNNASPHDFSLRPSDLKKIHSADFVVWVGESLEGFMEKPLENDGKLDSSIEWMAIDGMTIRAFAHEHHHHHDDEDEDHDHDHDADHDEDHDHDHDADHDEDHDHDHDADHDEDHDHDHDADHDEDHDHDHDADHDEDHDHDHDADHDEDEDHDHEEGHHHDHSGNDPHVWLNPDNAIALAIQVEKRLSNLAPDYAKTYQANLQSFIKEVKATDKKVAKDLSVMKGVNYVVFHDGYGYFESHYGIEHAGEVTLSPERKPGAKKVAELRHMVEEDKVSCFFAEPQFSSAIIRSITEDTSVTVAKLDPLGSDVKLDIHGYSNLITDLANKFLACKP